MVTKKHKLGVACRKLGKDIQKAQRCGMVGEVMSLESGFGQWGKTSFLIVREDSKELRYQETKPKLL